MMLLARWTSTDCMFNGWVDGSEGEWVQVISPNAESPQVVRLEMTLQEYVTTGLMWELGWIE